jgi:hypothetical protein
VTGATSHGFPAPGRAAPLRPACRPPRPRRRAAPGAP